MAWSMEECEGIDCSFFVDFFGKEVISNAPRTPGSSQNLKRPIDRVMEQLGSKSNKDVFRLLRQSLNVVKGDVNTDPFIFFRPRLNWTIADLLKF